MNDPKAISPIEWLEIMRLPEISEYWGLEPKETPDFFASIVYGAKFHYVNDNPGYIGDVFVLFGSIETDFPILLVRDDVGKLIILNR